jgi:hypothetical protein
VGHPCFQRATDLSVGLPQPQLALAGRDCALRRPGRLSERAGPPSRGASFPVVRGPAFAGRRSIGRRNNRDARPGVKPPPPLSEAFFEDLPKCLSSKGLERHRLFPKMRRLPRGPGFLGRAGHPEAPGPPERVLRSRPGLHPYALRGPQAAIGQHRHVVLDGRKSFPYKGLDVLTGRLPPPLPPSARSTPIPTLQGADPLARAGMDPRSRSRSPSDPGPEAPPQASTYPNSLGIPLEEAQPGPGPLELHAIRLPIDPRGRG